MKKTILIIFTIIISFSANAQNSIAEIWTEPAVYRADEAVSWYFDVTGTQLEGETEGVYLWVWFPSEPDAGHWDNSSEFAKLTNVEGNVWRMDLTPTEYFGVDASSIVAFYGLLKNKDGSKVSDPFAPDQTPRNDIQMFNFANIEGDALMEYFPVNFSLDRPLSILVNTNNTWSGCDATPAQGALAGASNVHIHSGVNFWEINVENNPANIDKTELTDIGNGIYRMDFVPNNYYSLPADYNLTSINFLFANDSWSNLGQAENCADFIILPPDAPEIIPPELIFFPQKISKKDIFTIIRKNNEPNVSEITYTISAGGNELATGAFSGNADDMRAYINLITTLKEVTATEINVLLKDNNDRTISDTNIPLVDLESK